MIVRYVNSKNEEVYLNQKPYRMLISDIMDYEWEVLELSGKIVGFTKKLSRKYVSIDVFANANCSSRKNVNVLTDIFEYDVINTTPGRLYIDECYLPCFFVKSKKNNWETKVLTSCEYELVTDNPDWITEEIFHFQAVGTTETAAEDGVNYLKYPYDYPYDYAPDSVISYLKNDSISPSDFKMTIYGPCTNPTVYYSDNICELSTMLREGEYITVDSRSKKIFKHFLDGTKENIVNSRNKKYRVFEPIRPGTSIINRNSSFGVDITIFKKRSEPKWSLL